MDGTAREVGFEVCAKTQAEPIPNGGGLRPDALEKAPRQVGSGTNTQTCLTYLW